MKGLIHSGLVQSYLGLKPMGNEFYTKFKHHQRVNDYTQVLMNQLMPIKPSLVNNQQMQ